MLGKKLLAFIKPGKWLVVSLYLRYSLKNYVANVMYISGDINRKTDNYFYHYTLYSLSVLSLAKNLRIIWEKSADN